MAHAPGRALHGGTAQLRERHDFLDFARPDLAAEITVTPVERLGVDAAILFADILLLLEPMGVGLEYTKGDGPVIHNPVSRTHVEQLLELTHKKPFRLSSRQCARLALP